MRQEAILGADIGTSSTKLALIGTDGRLLAAGEAAHPVTTPLAGHVESDPATWTAAVDAAAGHISSAIGAARLLGIGVVGQMHGAVLCDGAGVPVGPAVMWPDRRAEAEVARWRGLPPRQRQALANPLVPGMTGPMVAWLAEHRPDLVERAEAVLLTKDVVRAALLDEPAAPGPVTDRSDASATLLWDVPADRWAVEVCDAVGVPARLLPRVVSSYSVVGRTAWAGRVAPGGSADVPVVAGGGDTPAALLASAPADLLVNFGTGVQVLAARTAPDRGGADGSTHLYAEAGDGWYAMAAVQNGGLALEWVARVLGLTWNSLMTAAAQGTAGPVTFLPFLSGERGGVASPTSHGGWLGLTTASSRDDLARAAVEGVVFTIRRSVELLGHGNSTGAPPVTLSGGGWRSALLCRLTADALGRSVRRVDVRSASATGAAMLAAHAAGVEVQPVRSAGAQLEPAPSTELEGGYRRWLDRLGAAED